MHQLVPTFILAHADAGIFHGRFDAVGLFVDISGFSAITNTLMAHGQHGAEVLAEIMRAVMDPLINRVYEQGGFVATSAGDAITALFPDDPALTEKTQRALAAAWAIKTHLSANGGYSNHYGDFPISGKIGLAHGETRWGIIQNKADQQSVYYFQGAAVDGSAAAEHYASAGDLILHPELQECMEACVTSDPVGEERYHRVHAVTVQLPPPKPLPEPSTDLQAMARFYPETLLTRTEVGEFRQAVILFISLPFVRTETQLRIFMESVFALSSKYGGLISRLDFGDKGTNLLVFWGAPAAHENDIERALNFILDLQTTTSIPLSAGITYRISHAGFIGGRLHEEYTCFGRGVNLAARLMASAPRGEIWVDEFIAKRAQKGFEIDTIGEQTFKGFDTPQTVYTLIERKEQPVSFYQGGLVGREGDLETLGRLFESAAGGTDNRLLIVSGEAGIGKSRLVHEFLRRVEEAGNFQYLLCQTDEILRQSFNPFQYMLRRYFGILSSQGEARNKRNFNRKIDDLIAITPDRQTADELDRTRAFLGALIGLEWADSLYEQLDAEGRYKNTFLALATLLHAESLRKPVVIFLEDMHQIDDDTKAFLGYFLRTPGLPERNAFLVLVVATSRDLKLTQDMTDLHPLQMHLQGLRLTDLQTLAVERLGAPVTEGLLQLLGMRAEGNPFYAEQILNYLIEENLLRQEAAGWGIDPDQVHALPVDVNALLVARLDHLTYGVRDTVQTASVLGREFELSLLCRILRRPDHHAALPEVKAAEQQAIWQPLNEMRYIFKHILMRDAAYQMQVHARRKALHALALEAHEQLYEDQLADYYDELAYHAEQAEIFEKALYYLRLAGTAAKDAYHNQLALHTFSRALALTPVHQQETRVDLLLERETIYKRLGNTTGRQRDLAELLDMLPVLEDEDKAIEILLRQSNLLLDTGKYEEAKSFAVEAVSAAENAVALLKQAYAFWLLTSIAWRQGRLPEASRYAERNLSFAQAARSAEEESLALNTLGLICIDQRKIAQAKQWFARCLELAYRTGNLRYQTAPLNNLGRVAGIQGNYTEAKDYYEQALTLARKTGDYSSIGIATGNLGFIESSLGNYLKSQGFLEQYLRVSRETGNPYHEMYALINLSACAEALGNPGAQQHARFALELARKIGDRSGEAWALTYLGHSLIATGESETAAAAYKDALAIRQELDQPQLAAEPAAGLAQAALERGDPDAARSSIDPVLAFLEAGGTLEGADQPFRVYLTGYRFLCEVRDVRAHGLLESAYAQLQNQAAKMPDAASREAYLNNISHHREIARAWRAEATATSSSQRKDLTASA